MGRYHLFDVPATILLFCMTCWAIIWFRANKCSRSFFSSDRACRMSSRLVFELSPVEHKRVSKRTKILIHEADLQSQPVVITISARVFCPSVRPLFSKSRKIKQHSSENSDRYWRDCGSGRVDHGWHTCLVKVKVFLTGQGRSSVCQHLSYGICLL